MKTVVSCLFVLVMMTVVAASLYSAPQAQPAPQTQQPAPAHSVTSSKLRDVIHIYQCNFVSEKATETEVEADVLEMLKATKATVGGEKFSAKVLWPVAVNNLGETDFQVLAIFTTFTSWGKVWDASRDPNSPLAKWEAAVGRNDMYECGDSAVWESVTIEDK